MARFTLRRTTVLALTAVPTLVFARDYLPGSAGARPVGVLTAAFLVALVGVLAARDVTSFLAFWELMTLVPAAANTEDISARAKGKPASSTRIAMIRASGSSLGTSCASPSGSRYGKRASPVRFTSAKAERRPISIAWT